MEGIPATADGADSDNSILDIIQPPAPGQSPLEGAVSTEGVDRIAETFSGLKDPYREILTLRAQDLPYDEIAEVLDIPLGTVMSRLWLARQRMTVELLNAGEYVLVSQGGRSTVIPDYHYTENPVGTLRRGAELPEEMNEVLTPLESSVIKLYFSLDMPFNEISDILDEGVRTVRKSLAEGRRKILEVHSPAA